MDIKKVVIQLPDTRKEAPGWHERDLDDSNSTDALISKRYGIESDILAPVGASLVEAVPGTAEELIQIAHDADAMLVSWGVFIGEEIISKLEKCLVLAVGSVGTDMVDVDIATASGIVVTNTPDVFIEETADHTLMLLLAAARRVRQMDQLVRQGKWAKGRPILAGLPRLWGQTLGLIGFGNIGTAVARRARGFGMHIIAYDPYVSELKMTAEHVEPVSRQEVLERSDYLTLHPPLNDETQEMIGESEFSAMKDSVVFINSSRGGVVDESAFIRALQSGKVAAAGLDVLQDEPPAVDNPMLSMDNVIFTPHAASATTRMRPAGRRRAAEEVALVLRGKWPMSAVNPSVLPRVKLERWQPYPMSRGPNR